MSSLRHLPSTAADAREVIASVEKKLASCGDAEARRLLAPLPRDHDDLEVRAALAALCRRFAHFEPGLPASPDEEPALRPLWDAAELAARPASCTEWPDERVVRAAAHLSASDVADPRAITERLASAEGNAALLSLEWADDAVKGFAMSPRDAVRLTSPLSTHADPGVRASYVEALAQPLYQSAMKDDAPLRRSLFDPEPLVLRRAIPLARRDDVPRLRELRDHEDSGVAYGAALALALLGDESDLAHDLEVRAAVLAHHRAARFPRPEHLPRLLEAFESDLHWTALEFARVTYTCRESLLTMLWQIPLDDARWARLGTLLAHVEGGEDSRDAAGLLRQGLAHGTVPENLSVFLETAARCPEFRDEEAVLAHLLRLPEHALLALRAIGGAKTFTTLRELLVASPTALGAARRDALDLCWMLAPDRLALLDERDVSSAARLDSLATPHPEQVERARQHGLSAFASVADVEHLPEVEKMFRAAFREETQFDPTRRPADADTDTEAERTLARYEERLRLLGRRVSRFDDSPRVLVRDVALRWLQDAESDAERVSCLQLLTRHPLAAEQLRYAHRLWRHPILDVQRAATEALLACDHVEGLTVSLARLALADDARPLRQGLRAIGHFGATWAEPWAIAALESPNMNVKKSAAEALTHVGSPACLPPVMGWLARHDNTGLRAQLLRVVERVAGDAATATLVDALEHASHRDNLLAALERRLRPADVVRLVRGGRPSGEWILQAAGETDPSARLELRGGDAEDVRRALSRARPAPAEAEMGALDVLELEGFSADRATAALEEDAAGLPASIRGRAAEWAAWALTDAADAHIASHRVLEAAASLLPPETALALIAHAETPDEVRLALTLLPALAERGATWRQRAIACARALPTPQGPQRWDALVELGATLTRGDIHRALDDLAMTRDLPRFLRRFGPSELARWSTLADDDARDEALHEALRDLHAPLPGVCLAPEVEVPEVDSPTTRRERLDRFLDGEKTPRRELPRLASALLTWPADPAPAERALLLLPHVPLSRRREWMPQWSSQFEAGDRVAARALNTLPEEELLAASELLGERALRALHAMPRDRRVAQAMRAAVLGEVVEPPSSLPVETTVDPLEGLDDAESLLAYAMGARDRDASRAVGRLGAMGAVDALVTLTDHRDPNPRTVAFRWLRKTISKTHYLDLALAHVAQESDVHLRRQLLRSLAHRAHEPAFPTLVALALDSDNRVAREAKEGIQRLGAQILPTLDHAIARERPDRARRLRALRTSLDDG